MTVTKAKKPKSARTADPEVPANKRDRRKAHERRADLRDKLWLDSPQEVWTRHENDGFVTIPRLLSLVTTLICDLSKGGDPSSVYVELWCRVYDEGYVQIKNELENAFAAGYSGNRAVRTWSERMGVLEDLGFIKIMPSGAQKHAHVLIVNPLLAVARLRKKLGSRISAGWWAAFVARADEVGSQLPKID